MSKRNKIVAGAVLAALLVGGGWLVFKGDKEDSNNSQSTSQTGEGQSGDLKPYTGSYLAKIVSTTGGVASTVTITIKDADTYSITSDSDGGDSKFIVDGTDFYLQNSGDEWVKYPSSQNAFAAPSLAAFTGYLQSADVLARYSGATVKGDVSCSVGKCKLYEYTSPGSDDKVSIFVDKSNGRIIEILTKLVNGDETKITYDYSATVDVQVPQNAKTMSVPTQ